MPKVLRITWDHRTPSDERTADNLRMGSTPMVLLVEGGLQNRIVGDVPQSSRSAVSNAFPSMGADE